MALHNDRHFLHRLRLGRDDDFASGDAARGGWFRSTHLLVPLHVLLSASLLVGSGVGYHAGKHHSNGNEAMESGALDVVATQLVGAFMKLVLRESTKACCHADGEDHQADEVRNADALGLAALAEGGHEPEEGSEGRKAAELCQVSGA